MKTTILKFEHPNQENQFIKKIIIICTLLISSSFLAQETKTTQLATNLGFGFYAGENTGGLCTTIDFTATINKNLIMFSYLNGEELNILSSKNTPTITEFSILYGRSYKPANWFAIDTYAGLGLLSKQDFRYNENGDFASFSVVLAPKFYIGKHFGMGTKSELNLNQQNIFFTKNIIFHFIF